MREGARSYLWLLFSVWRKYHRCRNVTLKIKRKSSLRSKIKMTFLSNRDVYEEEIVISLEKEFSKGSRELRHVHYLTAGMRRDLPRSSSMRGRENRTKAPRWIKNRTLAVSNVCRPWNGERRPKLEGKISQAYRSALIRNPYEGDSM